MLGKIKSRASSVGSKAPNVGGLKSKVAGGKANGAAGGEENGGPRGNMSRSASSTTEEDESESQSGSESESEEEEQEEETPKKKKASDSALGDGGGMQNRKYGKFSGKVPYISLAADSAMPDIINYSHVIKRTPTKRIGGEPDDAIEDGDLDPAALSYKGDDDKKTAPKAGGGSTKKAGGAAAAAKKKRKPSPPSSSESESSSGSESDSGSESASGSSEDDRKKASKGRKAAAAAGAGAAASKKRSDSKGRRTPTQSKSSKAAAAADDDDDEASDDTAKAKDDDDDDTAKKAGIVGGIGAGLAGAGAYMFGKNDDSAKENGKPGKGPARGDDGYVETETDDGEDIMAPMRKKNKKAGDVTDSTVSGSGSDADRKRWAKKDKKKNVKQDKISTPSTSRRGSETTSRRGSQTTSRRGSEAAAAAGAAGAAAAAEKKGKKGGKRDVTDESTSEMDSEEEALAGRKKKGGKRERRESTSAKRSASTKTKDPIKSLTREDRHYLNKALICLEMQREWSALSQLGELTMYGYPFGDQPVLPSAAGGLIPSFIPVIGSKKQDNTISDWEQPVDAPILSYLFNRFIYGFPGLRDAKREYWTDNIQPFFDGFAQRNLSWTRERSEITKRRMLSMGFTRLLSTYFNVGITAVGEESPARPSLGLMREIDGLFPGRMESMYKACLGIRGRPKKGNGFNAWVAVPRQDGTEFVIGTQVLANARKPLFFVVRPWRRVGEFFDELEDCNVDDELALPVLPTGGPPDRLYLQRALRLIVIALSNPPKATVGSERLTKARSALEKFLLEEPLKVSEKTRADLMARAERDDRTLEAERKRWTKVGKHVRTLRTTWNMWRDALIGTDELDRSWGYLARYDRIEKLPQIYRDAEDWARLWVAYVITFMLVEGPAAGELLSLLTRFHKLIPYELLKQGLKIVNPTLAIKVVVNTVLAQPMGQPSLFQRIFQIIASGDIRARNKDIERLKGELGDKEMAKILDQYVYAEREDQEATREDSYEAGEDIVITILRRAGMDSRVDELQGWRQEYLESGGSSGGGRKFELLKELLRALCLKRDREQVIEIVMEPNTPNLLKASIRVFYNAIYNIAEASNLARALGDLQAFITDLLDCIHHPKQKNMVAGILKVLDKHEPSLWYFLHELARHGDLTDPLREWCRDGLGFLKVGIPAASKGKGGGKRRLGVHVEKLMQNEDPEVSREMLDEVRAVADWTRYQKALADLRYRVDFLAKEGIELDFKELAEEVILRDKGMAAFKEKYSGAKGEGKEEDVMGWAWWAGSDILDNPGDVQVDWIEKKKADKAAQKKKGKKGGLFGGGKSKGDAGEEDGTKEDRSTRFLPTPPRLHATRAFLDGYLDQVTDPIFGAKEQEQEAMANRA